MSRWPLVGGSYNARNVIANKQRCVNLYPERNPKDAPVPVTYYGMPGLIAGPAGYGVGRGLYVASDSTLYGCSGTKVFKMLADQSIVELGDIPLLPTPVSMQDNNLTLVVTDGSNKGWTSPLGGTGLTQISDPSGLFQGSIRVEYTDTYTLFAQPNTRNFYCSLSNTIEFDSTYTAAATATADLLKTLGVLKREIWLIKTFGTEIWYNAGAASFPFQILPGPFVQWGICAPYSLAKADVALFWLGQNREGRGIVLRGANYQAVRISNHAIETEIQGYSRIDDAIGTTFQVNGHIFYVLHFPTADKTWVYDEASEEWLEWLWMDSAGALHRHRTMSIASAYGKLWGMDWQTGQIYEVSTKAGTDAGGAIVRIKGFPHMPRMEDERTGKPVDLSGKRIEFLEFKIDISVGQSPNTMQDDWYGDIVLGADGYTTETAILIDGPAENTALLLDSARLPEQPKITLRWSNSRGKSWDGVLQQGLGSTGQYNASLSWNRLGIARDRVWELSWTSPDDVALQGAWVRLKALGS